jgi:hypothetical protein
MREVLPLYEQSPWTSPFRQLKDVDTENLNQRVDFFWRDHQMVGPINQIILVNLKRVNVLRVFVESERNDSRGRSSPRFGPTLLPSRKVADRRFDSIASGDLSDSDPPIPMIVI